MILKKKYSKVETNEDTLIFYKAVPHSEGQQRVNVNINRLLR